MKPESPSLDQGQIAVFYQRHRTGLVTLVFTDLVDSTALMRQLGDQASTTFLQQRRQIVRLALKEFAEGEEIETAGDSFLLIFAKPSDAVRFALLVQARFRAFRHEKQVGLLERIGIHLGEVVIKEHETEAKAKDLYGIQIGACARVMSLAQGGQVLMTRGVFDSARQVLKGEDIPGVGRLSWVSHGPYLLKGIEEPVEVCEVGEVGQSLLSAPKTTEKAERYVAAEGEPVLGWRPAIGQEVPNTKWVLEEKLGEGGFGEVWLGRHQTMKERRVFKFCFCADRVRSLKREMTLFRLIKERIGDHPNIVRLLEVYFEEPPFYVVMDHVEGQDLKAWCEHQGGAEKVPLKVKLEIVAQIADALQAAHDAGVIHRDVKPGNILVRGEGRGARGGGREASSQTSEDGGQRSEVGSQRSASQSPAGPDLRSPTSTVRFLTGPSAFSLQPSALEVKLTDFGIGQVVSEEVLKGVTKAGFTQTIIADSSSSQTGSQMYMAPELLAGKPATTRSDIYSLGVVLYQLLAGDLTRPLTTDWAESISDSLLREDLKHCFSGNPQDRFAGAGQLAKNLRALPERRAKLEQQRAELAARERAAYRRGVWRAAAISTAVVSVMALALVVILTQSRNLTRINAALRKEQLDARQNLYAADMLLAQQAMAGNDLGRARKLLDRHRPRPAEADLRGWEWRYLWKLCRSDELFTLGTCSNAVRTVTWFPDGRHLLTTVDLCETLQLWDVIARREVTRATVGVNDVLAISPDGKLLATGTWGTNGLVKFWEGSTLRELTPPVALPDAVEGAVFDPAGKTLLTVGGGLVIRWDVSARREISRHQLPPGRATTGLTSRQPFSPEQRIVALWREDGTIVLWDLVNARLQATLSGPTRPVTFTFSPDGRQFVASFRTTPGRVDIWRAATGEHLGTLTNHLSWVSALSFSRDGHLLATGSYDQVLKLWDTANWQEVATLRGHLNEIWNAAFAPDGQTIATASKDETVRIWSAIPKLQDRTHFVLPEKPEFMAFSPSGDRFITASEGVARVVESRSLLEKNTGRVSTTNIRSAALSPGAAFLAIGSETGAVELWNCKNWTRAANLQWESILVGSLAFSPTGKALAAGRSDGTIRVWDLATRSVTFTLNSQQSGLDGLQFSPDGTRLASTGDLTVRVWSVSTGAQEFVLQGHKARVTGLAFSPDARLLATTSLDGTARVWDLATHREVVQLRGQLTSVFAAAFSPDGQRLATGNGEGPVKLYDLARKQELAALGGASLPSAVAVFFFDDDTIVARAANEVIVWRAASFAEINAAEKAQASAITVPVQAK